VLVLEDRAQVTRALELELSAGQHRLAVGPVTPLAADRSLRCRVRPATGGAATGRLLDLRLEREYRVRSRRPEREREITAALDRLEDDYNEVLDEARTLFHQRELVQGACNRLARQLQDRLAVGPPDAGWPRQLEQLFSRRESLERELLQFQWAQDDRLARLARLLEERAQALEPVPEYAAQLLTTVELERDGSYRLEWDYQVPCALWRPAYTARLEQGGAAVRWTSAGTVWQRTGEDWRGVRLSLSTARPTLGADLPLLSDDVLKARDKSRREREVVEVSSRDEQIAVTSSVPEERRTDTPPGLDDGGEARTFTAPERVDVPSDGCPHRVPFESWEAEAEAAEVCMPERRGFVFLRTLQDNPSRLPLLAGPVALVREGGFVGRSQIGYVAPGEQFALSWGSEDSLVVQRHVTREQSRTPVRRHRRDRFTVEVYLANHSGVPRELQLVERIPVSEIESVTVELDPQQTTAGHQMDAQGLVRWQLALEPGAEQQVQLSFRVSRPSNVHWDG
jgi:uncharacterized protein (TIGR02231 family)